MAEATEPAKEQQRKNDFNDFKDLMSGDMSHVPLDKLSSLVESVSFLRSYFVC